MLPIVTPTEMAAIDAAAPEPVEVLIDRAARHVAREAIELMGGVYGRRVTVLAGPGNNGSDGRVAAAHLARRGVRVSVVDALDAPESLRPVDLVIDAAFGTGLARAYLPPVVAQAQRVLAVDIPSGVDGLTGERLGLPMSAERTVTFAALKPGLVLEPGRSLAGEVRVVDIGLNVGSPSRHAVEDADVAALVPMSSAEDHKWRSGVRIVGGSGGMTGAAWLAARAAQRAGAGMVQSAMPGARGSEGPTEAVVLPLPAVDWAQDALGGLDDRVRAMLVGPGLGRDDPQSVRAMLEVPVPLVIDGDGLTAEVASALEGRPAPTILTPHDGEWQRLGGDGGPDRLERTREFAIHHQVTVIRKGPSTVIADPGGHIRVVTSGTEALATAGTGDVLAGFLTALLAQGLAPFDAATVAAHVHGAAGRLLGPGLIAGDLPDTFSSVVRTLA
ncbi:MAG: NAD(P)H-hydrate dehydratase [Acidimicrobiaceae bacterium]|nr:NAD(P)H-hydrate dehydratase [Acidimicrobiaceae bacterium]MYG55018.1 NAD(P)H-hydrate dehydratase [Acidimicrobiaceae bacterium]MYJ98194.1 NAD(P)H-hydrate dehydratase [Acidimicrobiaceae bacterium]